jgi:hypothetical protein
MYENIRDIISAYGCIPSEEFVLGFRQGLSMTLSSYAKDQI